MSEFPAATTDQTITEDFNVLRGIDLQYPLKPRAIRGPRSWQVEDKIFELREFGTDPAGQTSVKPVISMTCNGCGQVVFLSALKTGVIGVAQAPELQPAEPATNKLWIRKRNPG